jgi:hypothetical protein
MSDIAILKEMINEKATVPLYQNNKKNQVILEETGTSKYSVTIYGMPNQDEVIVIKADNFTSPNAIFKGEKGECKRSDFVIIAATERKKVILCIELKATKDDNKKIIQQLTGSKCFVTYCKEIGKAFWNQKKFLDKYQYRFVSIGYINIPKREIRAQQQNDIHDCPEKMMKISNSNHLAFNHLVGGK